MLKLFLLAVGGAVGTLLRFSMMSGVYALTGRTFPYGTFSVNLLGSFLAGLCYVFFARKAMIGGEGYSLVVIGVLGAFTTFSTFSIETISLIEAGQPVKATLNIILSVGLCLLGCWLGLILGRALTL